MLATGQKAQVRREIPATYVRLTGGLARSGERARPPLHEPTLNQAVL
jgi:hypothetical protein